MRRITREEREKIELVIKKIKYRIYQAEIQLASHDHSRLRRTAKSISLHARNISFSLRRKRKLKM